MMYTVNYAYHEIGRVLPVKHIGAIEDVDERIVVKFARLEDAFEAARAIRSLNLAVFVSNTEDPDGRYLIPNNPT